MKSALLTFFLISCITLQNNWNNEQQVTKIMVVATDFMIQTARSIDCGDFDRDWGPRKDTFYVQDKRTIQRIFTYLNDTKVASDSTDDIDTRAKMYIFYKSQKTDTLCFSSTVACFINGKQMELKTNDLMVFIDSFSQAHK